MSARSAERVSAGGAESPSPNELVKAVDQLLNELGPKFSKVSAELFTKMDEMAQRLDDMEAAIKAGNDAGDPSN